MLLIGVASALGAGLAWGWCSSPAGTASIRRRCWRAAIYRLRPHRPGACLVRSAPHAPAQPCRLARSDEAPVWSATCSTTTCLASAIQRLAGAPVPTMIIGTLPLVIAVVANLGAERVVAAPGAAHGRARRGLALVRITTR